MDKTLDFDTQFGKRIKVSLDINTYANNGCLYIGLVEQDDEYPEPYGDMTVNLDGKAPSYCGYIDTNNMPQLEKFITENDIGEFTGLIKRSGYCEYPLYFFNVDRLRELCPEGMQMYESAVNKDKTPAIKEKAR